MTAARLLRACLRQTAAHAPDRERAALGALLAIGKTAPRDSGPPYEGSPQQLWHAKRRELWFEYATSQGEARVARLAIAFLRWGPVGFDRIEPNTRQPVYQNVRDAVARWVAQVRYAEGATQAEAGLIAFACIDALIAHSDLAAMRQYKWEADEGARAARNTARRRARLKPSPPWYGALGPVG